VATTPLINAKQLTKSFGDNEVIKGVDLTVDEGEIVVIIGISGCGKSTLLKLLSGLISADSGTVELGSDNFSFVFQYSALFDSMTVFENVAFTLEEPDDKGELPFGELSDVETHDLVCKKLSLVGMGGTEDLYPSSLSGGMKKRVSFARAIVSNPKIIFYDEPTAGLDPIASTQLEDDMLKLRDELGAASVVVTHQYSTIHRTADRICLLHEGEIVWQGTPEELKNSEDPYAYQFHNATLDGPLAKEYEEEND
jgi:phospholipid/cholesterol/gamma-HCH transport system ATP-binding protein